ncbi:aspartate/glutamate racemase family protein [Niveibacterium terrae]|uniref:aspartate/glutamate racemase family protein n=1 Tax=Niveibacterium terrae TaxID=3373598 RepID=UPI003A928509
MKSIGLIGGMSWESTVMYYQVINREVGRRLGGLRSAPLAMLSVDFEEIASRQKQGDWEGMAAMLSAAARSLVRAGADCVLIGTNTMHKVAPEVQASVDVPLLHIADVTADAIVKAGCRTVGLMGTRFTMEQGFYVERLNSKGVECVIPDEAQRAEIHRIIFDELCRGIFKDSSRAALKVIVADLAARGAQGVVLGCTELPLILSADDVEIPVFDTTTLHALAAVEFALN